MTDSSPNLVNHQIWWRICHQFCHQIPREPSSLFLLVDSNPYQLRSENEAIDRESFRVYIHTLAPHTAYGRGSYGMHTLKRMTGTTNFHQLPDKQKKCRIHNREECQTKMVLSLLKTNCSCVPWLLVTDNKKVFQELSFHPTSRSCRCPIFVDLKMRHVWWANHFKTNHVWFPALVSTPASQILSRRWWKVDFSLRSSQCI